MLSVPQCAIEEHPVHLSIIAQNTVSAESLVHLRHPNCKAESFMKVENFHILFSLLYVAHFLTYNR